MEPIIGIDLGTTNSEAAFIIDGRTEILKEDGNGILPSCVGLSESGEIVVGAAAKNQAALYPQNTVLSVKRLMGSSEKIGLGDQTYTPPEISAFILKKLKERAERVLGQPVRKAVITTPAYFTDAQRQATREAGEIAGLTVVRILNEPTAAALAYERRDASARTILVYDLGGGTFDVSIVKIEDGVVEVLASTGDNHLGGDDFDAEIEKLLLQHLKAESGIDLSEDRVARARLRNAAEKAKISLSDAPYATVEEDHIARKKFKSIHLSYELSRQDFEAAIAPYLEKTMDSVNKALEDARVLPASLDKIILVGGSTRIPRVSEMLEEKFRTLPYQEIDPDLCVAMGAAIQAGREMGLDSASVLLDITPYTFGTSALGEVDGMPATNMFVPLIRRNTKLPAAKSEVFWTVFPDQPGVQVDVYQGENENALKNIQIGTYRLKLTPHQPAQSPIVIKYELDLNGILKITAVERNTGRQITGVIENAFSEISQEDVESSRARIDEIWKSRTTEPQEESHDLPPEIAQTIASARAALKTAGPEDSEDIINLIEDITDAANASDLEKANDLAGELKDLLFYLE